MIMMKAQQEANQQVMQEMMKHMTAACFDKCAGTSVRILSLVSFRVPHMPLFSYAKTCGWLNRIVFDWRGIKSTPVGIDTLARRNGRLVDSGTCRIHLFV